MDGLDHGSLGINHNVVWCIITSVIFLLLQQAVTLVLELRDYQLLVVGLLPELLYLLLVLLEECGPGAKDF